MEQIVENNIVTRWERFFNENINYIKSELQDYYPDNWDVQINDFVIKNFRSALEQKKEILSNVKNVEDFNDHISLASSTAVKILIHFPEITIRNSNDQSHIIKDLFIKIELSPILRESVFVPSYFSGWRATRSVNEHNSNYSHSHLPRQNSAASERIYFDHFCLGNTNYNSLAGRLKWHFDKENFTLLIQQLRDYLAYESLEGVPYIRMSSIVSQSHTVTDLPNDTIDICVNLLIDFLKDHPNLLNEFKYSLVSTACIDLLKFRSIRENTSLLKILYSEYTKLPSLPFVYYINGVLTSNIGESLSNSLDPNRSSLKFKDRNIRYNVVNSDSDKEQIENEPDRYLHPSIFKRLVEKLEKTVNDLLVKDFQSESEL